MQKQNKLWNRDFVTLCISSFFLFMTFYILAVTLPIFVIEGLKVNKQQIGLVMTVFIIAAVVIRPLAGKWLDELPRKQILVVSLALYTGCSALYLAVENFEYLLLIRFLHGVGFGIATTATGTIIIDTIPKHRKGEGIGYYSLFMSIAMVIGPFLGLTIMDHFTNTLLFIVCLSFAILSFICGIIAKVPKGTVKKKKFKTWHWKRLIEIRAIPISLAGSIIAFAYGGITTFITSYAKEMGISQIASYFFVVFAVMIVISRPFTGKLFDRLGEHFLVYPGIGLFTLGMLALSQVFSPLLVLVAAGILGLGYGALIPSFQAIAVKVSPKNRRGLAVGTYFVLFDSGFGLGAYFLGYIASKTNYHTMYLIAAIISGFSGLIYYTLYHRKSLISKVSYKVTAADVLLAEGKAD